MPYEYLTAREYLELQGHLSGLTGATLRSEVARVLTRVEMNTHANMQIRRYSKGMIQRISLAQALVGRPELLILDEPTSGLDVLGRQLIRDIVLEERRKGTAVLFCSHIIPDVESLCDRVAVIIGGKAIQTGTVGALIESDKNQMEIVVEDAPATLEETVKALVTTHERVGARVRLFCPENASNQVLQSLLSANARIVTVQRTRFTLEELFIKAVKESGQAVGSFIS